MTDPATDPATTKSFRSSIGRARGLGSAKEGTAHWWMQRLTALAMIPLAFFLVCTVIKFYQADYFLIRAWVGWTPVAITLILTCLVTFYHAAIGCQVVIEDYIHHEGAKIAAVVGVNFVMVILAAVSVFSVLRISFGPW